MRPEVANVEVLAGLAPSGSSGENASSSSFEPHGCSYVSLCSGCQVAFL